MQAQLIYRAGSISDEISKSDVIIIDTETKSRYPHRDAPALAGLAVRALGSEHAYYMPVRHVDSRNASLAQLRALGKLLVGKTLVAHNIKFDLAALYHDGVNLVNERVLCSLVLMRLIEEDLPSYELEHIAATVFKVKDAGEEKKRLKKLMRDNGWVTYDQIPAELILNYVMNDVALPELLYEHAMRLINERDLNELLELEIETTRALFWMELTGFKVDSKFIDKSIDELDPRVKDLKTKLYKHVRSRLRKRWNDKENLSEQEQAWLDNCAQLFAERNNGEWQVKSHHDVRRVFHGLGIKSHIETAKGNERWNQETLKTLRDPAANKILELRAMLKPLEYFENLRQLRSGDDLIHCSVMQAGAKTGRTSAREPNLQNLPRADTIARTWGDEHDENDNVEELLQVRNAFIPREGNFLLFADWSQVELRVLADYAQEQALINAFTAGLDVHALAARAGYGELNDSADSDDRKVWRRKGKDLNFGMVYGIGKPALALRIGSTVDEAGLFIDRYFQRFPNVRKFIDTVRSVIKQRAYAATNGKGWVRNRWGRRRYLTDRQAWLGPNFLVQGTSGDLMKSRLCAVQHELIGYETKLLMVVHDEYIFDVPYDEYEKVVPVIVGALEKADHIKIPIKVELKWSKTNWGEAEELACDVCSGRGFRYEIDDEVLNAALFKGTLEDVSELARHTCARCAGAGYDLFKVEGFE